MRPEELKIYLIVPVLLTIGADVLRDTCDKTGAKHSPEDSHQHDNRPL